MEVRRDAVALRGRSGGKRRSGLSPKQEGSTVLPTGVKCGRQAQRRSGRKAATGVLRRLRREDARYRVEGGGAGGRVCQVMLRADEAAGALGSLYSRPTLER